MPTSPKSKLVAWLNTLGSVASSLLFAIGWLGQQIFGQLHWQAPAWLYRSGQFLAASLQAQHRLRLYGFIGATTLAFSGYYAWHWYQHRPQPMQVKAWVTAPNLTQYQQQPIYIHPLQLSFTASVAPLTALKQQIINQGIQLKPALSGQWLWRNDRELVFNPEQDWPINQEYRIQLDPKLLLIDTAHLAQTEFRFQTPAFALQVAQSQLYQDPQRPELKQLVVDLSFSHPVDEASLRQHLSVQLGAGIDYKTNTTAFSLELDATKTRAYVHSAALTTPLETSRVQLNIASGIHSLNHQDQSRDNQSASVEVPGRYQLQFSDIHLDFVQNEQNNTEAILLFNSSSPLLDSALDHKVQAWLLPELNAQGSANWSDTDINQDLLAHAEKLNLSHIASSAPLNSQHAFKLQLTPGRYLYLKIAGKVEAIGGYLSRQPQYQLLEMPVYPQELHFVSDGALLSLSGETSLAVMARGIKTAQLQIAQVLPHQLQHLVDLNNGSFSVPSLSDDEFERMVATESQTLSFNDGQPGQAQYRQVNLKPYLQQAGGRQGIFVLRLQTPDQVGSSSRSDLRFIVVSDLGIIAKVSQNGSHDVFVQSLANGQAVSKAEVAILGRNGQPLAHSQTDEQGHAHFEQLGQLQHEKTPLLYLVQQGKDQSFLPITRQSHQLDLSRFDVGGLQPATESGQLSAYVFSDRGLYRPGETTHLGFIVRNHDWQAKLQGLPLELEISDPRGQSLLRQKLSLSASGFDSLDFTSNSNAPAGDYRASLQLIGYNEQRTPLGSALFKVRDFAPDTLKLQLSLTEQPVIGWLKPEQVKPLIRAEHLFGGPASDRQVSAELSLNPAFAEFAAYPNYHFHLEGNLQQPQQEQLQPVTTDSTGLAQFDLQLQRFAQTTYQLQLLAELESGTSGRKVVRQTGVLVSSAAYLVGYHSSDPLDYISKNAERPIHWLAINPELQALAVSGLQTELIEHRPVSVLVKQDNGTYRYQSHIKDISLAKQSLDLDVTGGQQLLPTDQAGDFSLRLTNADGQLLNEIAYQVSGASNTGMALERNAELQIKLNKSSYAAGEEIQISLRAPYTGSGLISIERDRVYAHTWFKTNQNSSIQTIKVPAGLEGNAYVNLTFIRDRTSNAIYQSPLSYGVRNFNINLDSRKLPLSLSSAAQIEPGQELRMQLNSPSPGRALVFAVDEGILQVARYKMPNPLAFFFQKRALAVSTSQILDLLLPEFSHVMTAAAPGGDDEAANESRLNPFKRKGKPPVVWWSGLVDLPAGSSEFSYPVPDSFNGQLHLFALMVDNQHIGIAESQTKVQAPLILASDLPPTVAPQDRFRLSFSLLNTQAETSVKVKLLTSAGLAVQGDNQHQLKLATNQERQVQFELLAQNTLGAADLQLEAELDNGKVLQLHDSIMVRPASVYQTTSQFGLMQTNQQQVKLSRDLAPEQRQVKFSFAASPLAWSQALVTYVQHQHYSSSEQRISEALTLVLTHPADDPQSRQQLAQQLLQLSQRQNQQGGLGSWSAQPESQPFPSLYLADMLLEAQQAGWPIPKTMQQLSLAYLNEFASAPSQGLSELRLRAYALYLLTRQGQVKPALLADIRQQLDSFYAADWHQDLTAAYLAATYQLLKQESEALSLVKAVPWRDLSGFESVTSYDYDPLIHNAELLNLLSRHFPQRHETQAPDWSASLLPLLQQQRYHPLSATLLLRALSHYQQASQQQLQLEVRPGQAESALAPLVLSGYPAQTELSANMSQLSLSKHSPLPAFYRLTEAGFDRQAPTAELRQGLEIQHDYLDLNGNALSQVPLGDEFLVRIQLRALGPAVGPVAVVDLLPGGVEVVLNQAAAVEPAGANTSDSSAAEASGDSTDSDNPQGDNTNNDPSSDTGLSLLPIGEFDRSNWTPDDIDLSYDRLVLYGTIQPEVQTFVYRVRATHSGDFISPAAFAEALYQPQIQARSLTGKLHILDAKKP